MRLEAGLHQRQELRLRLAPQVIQSIEMLQLPALALEEVVKQEMLENPALELREDTEEPEAAPAEAGESAETTERLEVLRLMEDSYQAGREGGGRSGGGGGGEDGRLDLLQSAPDRRRSLQEHLTEQLRLAELTPRMRAIAEQIIYNLDGNGYLSCGVEEVAASLPELFADRSPDEAGREVEQVLRLIQALDPPGVAARDTRECLLLQLKPGDPACEIKERLIREHLEDIQENRLPRICRDLELPPEECQALVAEIRAMNPKPGANFAGSAAPAIVPDVVVRSIDGEYEVILEESYIPPVVINPYYLSLLQNGSLGEAEKEFVLRKIESARRLITAIEQRRVTITRIAREIVKAQRPFFDEGIAHLKPMKMQQIADTIGVHVSTVSRAIADKYIQTPRGIYPLRFFFSRATDGAAGESESKVNVIDRIRELVAGEDPRAPLSDLDLVHLMKERYGFDLARRTVTKYRKALKIASSRHRKTF
jgi:RNA polymerase sigma-54 factor